LAILQLGNGHAQEGQTAIEENNHREDWGDPLAAWELGQPETNPFLKCLAEQKHRHGERQAYPKPVTEHAFVTGVTGSITMAYVVSVRSLLMMV
jgi:hypothetical protein